MASALPGCIILPVPIPIPPSGTRGEVVEQLRIGESSSTEVHALLGAPNRLASARYDVYDLEYDPLHFYLIMGIGGPGGGGGDVVPLGERESRTRVAVEYDRERKVAGWRWEGRTLGRALLSEGEEYRDYVYGTSEPGPTPVQPSRVLPWVLPEPVQAHAISSQGEMAKDVAGARSARQVGRFVIVDREDGGVSVWDVAGERVAVLALGRSGHVVSSATISADGSQLAIERAVEFDAMPTVILYDIATGTQRTLTLPGPAQKPQPLAALALAPKGNLLAINRWSHIEVWRLGTSDEAPVLEAALPLPPPTMAGVLGFSADGRQLIAKSLGAFTLVWETAGWQVVGRGSRRAFSSSSRPSDAVKRDTGSLADRAKPPSAPTATTNRIA